MMVKLGKVSVETMGAKSVRVPESTGDPYFPV